MRSPTVRSKLAIVLTRYLALKEALGRRYAVERDVLRHLDRFLAARRGDLTADTFAAWVATQLHLTAGVRRNRMRIVRNFCLYRRRTAPSCFVPDLAAFPHPHQPLRPHIFSPQEIGRLLMAVDAVAGRDAILRRATYRLAIVLLYTAGLRRGELLRLRGDDYDTAERTLRICASKFHKSRLVPLSADGVQAVDAYLTCRRAHGLTVASDAPLLGHRYRTASGYSHGGLAQGLRRLLHASGVRTPTGAAPRVHDLRHTFAVHALLRWYRAGADVEAKLPFLAAYMGHVSIVSTAYYLQFVPEVASAASDRFAKQCGALVTPRDAGSRP